MDTTPTAVASSGIEPSTRRVPRGLIPANLVLLGTLLSLVGISWDIQWHNDVGPDTFFTLPHLFLYAGSALSGLASLAAVLVSTAQERGGRTVDPLVGGPAVAVFGRTFAAPVGYLVSGSGAAMFLLYGLWDQWWHGVYGFDATLSSPPHVGLFFSITITLVGAVIVFAAARRYRWGQTGAIVASAVLVAFAVVLVEPLEELQIGPANLFHVGIAFVCVLVLTMCAAGLARPATAVAVAAVVAAMQTVLWWFAPWAAEAYAQFVGLPLRDYIDDAVPMHPALIPMVLVVVGTLLTALRRLPSWAVGALGGAVLGVCGPMQEAFLKGDPIDTGEVLVTMALATVSGVVAGHLGTRVVGEALRLLAMADARDPALTNLTTTTTLTNPKKETHHA